MVPKKKNLLQKSSLTSVGQKTHGCSFLPAVEIYQHWMNLVCKKKGEIWMNSENNSKYCIMQNG
jgi:hypothetical protein